MVCYDRVKESMVCYYWDKVVSKVSCEKVKMMFSYERFIVETSHL